MLGLFKSKKQKQGELFWDYTTNITMAVANIADLEKMPKKSQLTVAGYLNGNCDTFERLYGGDVETLFPNLPFADQKHYLHSVKKLQQITAKKRNNAANIAAELFGGYLYALIAKHLFGENSRAVVETEDARANIISSVPRYRNMVDSAGASTIKTATASKGTETTRIHGFFKFIIILTLIVIACVIGLAMYGNSDGVKREVHELYEQKRKTQLRVTDKLVVPVVPRETVDPSYDDFCGKMAADATFAYGRREKGDTFEKMQESYQSKGRKDGWPGYLYRIGYRALIHAFSLDLGRDHDEVLKETYQSCMVTDDDNFLELRELYYKHNP